MTDGPKSHPSEVSHLWSKWGLNFSQTLSVEWWSLENYVHQEPINVSLFEGEKKGVGVFASEITLMILKVDILDYLGESNPVTSVLIRERQREL